MTRGLGILHMAISGILLLAGVAFCYWLSADQYHGEGFGFFLVLFSIVALSYPIPGFIGGLGLVLDKHWARGLMFVLSLILLFAFPIGTLLGGFGLWVLVTDAPPIPLGTPDPYVPPSR